MDTKFLPRVVLTNGVHRNARQVFLRFKYDDDLMRCARQLCRWSATLKCWYVPYKEGCIDVIKNCFKGVAMIDSSGMMTLALLPRPEIKKRERMLNDVQRDLLNTYYRYLQGKRYSDSTVKTYTYLVADFVEFCGGRAVEGLTNRDVELFIEDVLKRKSYSISTQRQFVSALKLFVVFCPVVGINNLELARPHKSRLLPTVLSQTELICLLRVTKNVKHRAILGLLYSGGLRIGELLKLTIKDLDFDRLQIFVSLAKGRKDRVVGMSQVMVPILLNYLDSYKPRFYVIEGRDGGMYSAVSIRSFLKVSCKAAGIKKVVTPHTLRHSYATHMLENGVDLRYIQELLGHSKPETTMLYTHVAQKTLVQISNPLDVAVNQLNGEVKKGEKVSISRQLHG